jgi:hypothetical protein
MKYLAHYLPQLAGSFILCGLTMSTALAHGAPLTNSADAGDPERWYQEDLTTLARFQNSKKEADAAYKEAVIECKILELENRSNCIRDARTQLLRDIEMAKKKLRPQ